jgi:hypothetical protein
LRSSCGKRFRRTPIPARTVEDQQTSTIPYPSTVAILRSHRGWTQLQVRWMTMTPLVESYSGQGGRSCANSSPSPVPFYCAQGVRYSVPCCRARISSFRTRASSSQPRPPIRLTTPPPVPRDREVYRHTPSSRSRRGVSRFAGDDTSTKTRELFRFGGAPPENATSSLFFLAFYFRIYHDGSDLRNAPCTQMTPFARRHDGSRSVFDRVTWPQAPSPNSLHRREGYP